MNYKDNENFVDDGIQIEPFNLDQERDEGYFDAAGNFVEYVQHKGFKRKRQVRFPKGKKIKRGDDIGISQASHEGRGSLVNDPRLIAKERVERRRQFTTELFIEDNRSIIHDTSSAEMNYKDNENFVDDGIQIEPFNLDQERDEGYFDAAGNFVEYVHDKGFKDAWLDSVEVDPRFAREVSTTADSGDDMENISSLEVGQIKRRIADLLEPGENVLQALKRFKGSSNDKKEKMRPEIKALFDQLTDDAVKLMENGEYNVYHEKREYFERESGSAANTNQSLVNISAGVVSPTEGADRFDMFADDESIVNPITAVDTEILTPITNHDRIHQVISDESLTEPLSETVHTDYVYDDASGYYYSSGLGYYYDPSSNLYCCAASGQWYSYEEGTYKQVSDVVAA